MGMAQLSPADFGYFSCNLLNDQMETYLFKQRICPDKTLVVSHPWELDWTHEQLRLCIKWDTVDCDFFHISNFMRQHFRFRSVNDFQSFGDNQDLSDAYLYQFSKNFVGGKKFKKQ